MGLLGVLLLGVGLSLDTFAVSLSLGFAGCTTHRQRMRFLIVIGIFHFLMIMAGWFLGENVSRLIADYDHWVAFGLLAIVGGKMIKEGLSAEGESVNCNDLLSLRNTLLLGVALSIDALITGFSLGMVKIRLFDGPPLGNTLLAALLIAVAVYVLLLKRGRGLLAALRGPADPPHVAAIKQLEKLHTQKLWQSGKSKQYYTGLTDILREYLAGRYNFQAMEMTSAEIIARIRELSVEERASKRLGSLLEVADFVKFAKYEPDAVQNEDAYQDAYYFVEETKQLPPELQPQQAGNDTPQGNVPGPTGTSGGLKPSGVPGAPDIPDTPGGAAAGGTSDEAGEGKEVRS